MRHTHIRGLTVRVCSQNPPFFCQPFCFLLVHNVVLHIFAHTRTVTLSVVWNLHGIDYTGRKWRIIVILISLLKFVMANGRFKSRFFLPV